MSIAPVFLFLGFLMIMDSYKLVRLRSVLFILFMGSLAAGFCFFINRWLSNWLLMDPSVFSQYIAPLTEETAKILYVAFLMTRMKTGFMVDAAVQGFASGTGFAFIENIIYLHYVSDLNPLFWLIRGLGTAVMHGGTTAIFAILSKNISDRYNSHTFWIFLPGWIIAIIIHSAFNHFLLPPIIMTIIQILILPILMIFIFTKSENGLRDWLELGFESDSQMLQEIRSGNISKTKIGQYLFSLKNHFSGIVVGDILCYLTINLELSIRAKGLLLMRETGFEIPQDPDVQARFKEMRYLEKSIGKTGRMTLSPILHHRSKDLWQLYFLEK